MQTPLLNFSAIQSIKNIASNVVLFIINVLIGFWYTPYLIRHLGSELFGFIPLTDSVTNYLGIITLSMNVVTGRFLTIELEKENTREANQIFNTAFFGMLLLISLAIPVATILILFAPVLFKVPVNHQQDIRILFIGTIAAFLLTTLRSNFSIATFARNRFDLRNIVTFGGRIGQIAVIIFLFYRYPANLLHVGIGALSAGILAFIGDFYLWRRLLPQLRLGLKAFKRSLLRTLMGTSIWMFIYQVGFILLMNTDMLVANLTLELKVAGMYGALLVIPKNLSILARTVGGVWGPTILSKYSKSDFSGMDRVVRFSIKLIGLTLALPIGLISGLSKPFLSVWLGSEYKVMAWVLTAMTFPLVVNLITLPFYNIQLTLNKLKFPSLVSMILGVLYFFLAIDLARAWGPIGIVVASALVLTIENFLIWPMYTAKVMRFHWLHYVKKLFPIVFTTLGVSVTAYYLGLIIPSASLQNLIGIGILVTCGYALISYRFGLTREEKAMIFNILRGFRQ